MINKMMKYENPVRVLELDPINTLKRIGVLNNSVVCDIGAGSGIFTIPAAKVTEKTVYAVEINDEMLSIISDKVKQERLENVELIKVKNDHYEIVNDSVDNALLITVLHEISNKETLLGEIKRILKDTGKVAVIEFHKKETPMGPLLLSRISKDEVNSIFANLGFINHKRTVILIGSYRSFSMQKSP